MAVESLNLNSLYSSTGIDNTNQGNSENSITSDFSTYLQSSINKLNDLQVESSQLNEDFATGKNDNIHQVMIAAEKADLSLQFAIQVRNKILDAYTEIMRMQI